jgi:hypothetical protein
MQMHEKSRIPTFEGPDLVMFLCSVTLILSEVICMYHMLHKAEDYVWAVSSVWSVQVSFGLWQMFPQIPALQA